MQETLGASYRVRTTLPASAHFSSPAPKNTAELPYLVKGAQPPRKGSAPNLFSSPIPVHDATMLPEGLGEGFQHYGGEPRMPEFDTGRNSNPEQLPSEDGPGTNEPAKTALPEAGEETSALGDVAGLAEIL